MRARTQVTAAGGVTWLPNSKAKHKDRSAQDQLSMTETHTVNFHSTRLLLSKSMTSGEQSGAGVFAVEYERGQTRETGLILIYLFDMCL